MGFYHLSGMDDCARQLILEHGWLFRGTTDVTFQYIKAHNDMYDAGCKDFSIDKKVMSTTLRIVQALICGKNRTESLLYRFPGCNPLLIAINPGKYMDLLRPGREFRNVYDSAAEIEIIGAVDFKDITVVDSLETFMNVCEKEFEFIRPSSFDEAGIAVEYFRRYYLGEKVSKG